MNAIQKIVWKIDSFQRQHSPIAFAYAVIKKYGEDQAGYQAALVTYYGFLSLFPLLLILSTVAAIVGSRDPQLGQHLVESVSHYFPQVGASLNDSIKSSHRGGIALVIGFLFALYGARGIADAFRNAVNHIWHIPLAQRSGFPRSLLRSVLLITGGGVGFITASVVAGTVSAGNHPAPFKIASFIINMLILYLVFMFILSMSLPMKISRQRFRVGAAVSAVGLASLQLLGTYILSRQSQSLSNSYSALFATTLGLLAWIYLQTQVIMYAVVIDTVRDGKLWPRSLSGQEPTVVDEQQKKFRSLV